MHKLELILKDKTANKHWKSPKHNKDRKKDDYHREVKPVIIKDLDRELKKRFGKNCDIEIDDNKIILISKRFRGKSIVTDLDPNHYFDEVLNFTVLYVVKNQLLYDLRIFKTKTGIIRIYIKLNN